MFLNLEKCENDPGKSWKTHGILFAEICSHYNLNFSTKKLNLIMLITAFSNIDIFIFYRIFIQTVSAVKMTATATMQVLNTKPFGKIEVGD